MTVILHPVICQVSHHWMRNITSHWMDYSYITNKKENSLSSEESMLLFDIVMGKHFSLKAVEEFTEVREDDFFISEQKLLWAINDFS